MLNKYPSQMCYKDKSDDHDIRRIEGEPNEAFDHRRIIDLGLTLLNCRSGRFRRQVKIAKGCEEPTKGDLRASVSG
jgi:hypothetical protein